jgi:ribosomal protein S12 methylthiotransferase
LLRELCGVSGIEWIRLHYAYPSKFPLEVLDTMSAEPKVCNYLDIPLQHVNDAVLRRMRRQITRLETEQLLEEARRRVPNIALRTTMLVGFPGETRVEFEELRDFVAEQQFHRLGVFQYSHEENTLAYDLADDVPVEEKEARATELMEVQREISHRHNERLVGQTVRTLFDRVEGGYFVGRTEADSPEVDNEVLVKADAQTYVRIGDFAMVCITAADEYDLYGNIAR